MLKTGDLAPDFSAKTTDGRDLRLSELRGKRVVLYFFPKAFTRGCSIETRRFQEAYPDLQALGAEVVGVSTDDHETQCAFADKEKVRFPMIGDAKRDIGKRYDVLWPILSLNQRVTYVIDAEGRIEAAFHHELAMDRHLDDVRRHLSGG